MEDSHDLQITFSKILIRLWGDLQIVLVHNKYDHFARIREWEDVVDLRPQALERSSRTDSASRPSCGDPMHSAPLGHTHNKGEVANCSFYHTHV